MTVVSGKSCGALRTVLSCELLAVQAILLLHYIYIYALVFLCSVSFLFLSLGSVVHYARDCSCMCMHMLRREGSCP